VGILLLEWRATLLTQEFVLVELLPYVWNEQQCLRTRSDVAEAGLRESSFDCGRLIDVHITYCIKITGTPHERVALFLAGRAEGDQNLLEFLLCLAELILVTVWNILAVYAQRWRAYAGTHVRLASD